MIPLTKPYFPSQTFEYLNEVLHSGHCSGDQKYTKLCQYFLEKYFGSAKVLLTTSGTHALEMAALILKISKGDEVILPSFTFSSTANAFALFGARLKFVDIDHKTLNIDPNCIEAAITPRTRAIIPVHYAGMSADMDRILEIARKHQLAVVEDAAQAIGSRHGSRHLGTLGELGCLSFHETKNLTCGEGGAILINENKWIDLAEMIREKGTNRSQLYKGEVDKYTWKTLGSSYLPSDLNAAVLWAQLQQLEIINEKRVKLFNEYSRILREGLSERINGGDFTLPTVPGNCTPNGHSFFIRVEDLKTRDQLIQYLRKSGIYSTFHYLPLHSSEAGRKFGEFIGEDRFTTRESEKLLRLPLFYELSLSEVSQITDEIAGFFQHSTEWSSERMSS